MPAELVELEVMLPDVVVFILELELEDVAEAVDEFVPPVEFAELVAVEVMDEELDVVELVPLGDCRLSSTSQLGANPGRLTG